MYLSILIEKNVHVLSQRNKFSDGEKIALLHDALQECLNSEQRIIIDIKETRTDVVQVVLDAYKKYPKLFERGIVSSFNPIIVYMVHVEILFKHYYIIYMPKKISLNCEFILNFTFRFGRKSHVLSRVLLGGRIIFRDYHMLAWKRPARHDFVIRLSIWQLASWRFCMSGHYLASFIILLAFLLYYCTRT